MPDCPGTRITRMGRCPNGIVGVGDAGGQVRRASGHRTAKDTRKANCASSKGVAASHAGNIPWH